MNYKYYVETKHAKLVEIIKPHVGEKMVWSTKGFGIWLTEVRQSWKEEDD